MRTGELDPGDDALLSDFLLSFDGFSQRIWDRIGRIVMGAPRDLDDAPFIAERTVKSSQAITDKLRRERTLRLDQIQDIVGCRIIVRDLRSQERVLSLLMEAFPSNDVKDRRSKPAYGYRAIHVIVRDGSLRYEIQLRTSIQNSWATLVELLISRYGIDVKYGGGPATIQERLVGLSNLFWEFEQAMPDVPGDLAKKIVTALANLELEPESR